jgi:hypothetical protein
MESTENLKSCRAKLLTPPLATLHPSPTMGGECHADRRPTPALPKGGNAMRTGSPPLPSQREGMPCGQGAHPYPPKGRECHADSSYMTLKHVYSAQQLPSHRRGGVRGGVSNFSVSPLQRITYSAASSIRVSDSL